MRTVALLRLPGQPTVAFSGNDHPHKTADNRTSVFHYVPFPGDSSPNHQLTTAISVKEAQRLVDEIVPTLNDAPVAETLREEYHQAGQTILDALKRDALQKVILSRVMHHAAPHHFSGVQLFDRLCATYPNAAIHLFAEEGKSLWIGSSPELLIKVKNQQLETVSLAGTQAHMGREINTIVWEKKERDEQQWVTEHIAQLLQIHPDVSAVNQFPLETAVAGNVVHLKTRFTAKVNTEFNWPNFVDALHPTPAIGGWPKKDAAAVIHKTEIHPRLYYGGYFGIESPNDLTLYVNLRCLRYSQNTLQLFVGGGYTTGSDIAAEWEETGHKAKTLLSVIENLQKLESQ